MEDGLVRVIDYKTGRVSDEESYVDDGSVEKTVESLFARGSGDRPEIALQVYLYDALLDRKVIGERKILNSVYSVIRLPKEGVRDWPATDRFASLMSEKLEALLGEIADTSVPFKRTENTKTCEWCDFKTLQEDGEHEDLRVV